MWQDGWRLKPRLKGLAAHKVRLRTQTWTRAGGSGAGGNRLEAWFQPPTLDATPQPRPSGEKIER